MPDQAAIRCLKNGDIGGLEILITRYQTRAMRAAYYVIQDEQLPLKNTAPRLMAGGSPRRVRYLPSPLWLSVREIIELDGNR
ncbi:MAG: hypothetical protein HPY59_03745 [Anaerolineae bacterium]|nr:hypothetical protein [Anaerolineae bacterium]